METPDGTRRRSVAVTSPSMTAASRIERISDGGRRAHQSMRCIRRILAFYCLSPLPNETDNAGNRVSSREMNGPSFGDEPSKGRSPSRNSSTIRLACKHDELVADGSGGEAGLVDLSVNIPPSDYSSCRIWPVFGS